MQDADRLLDLATDALNRRPPDPPLASLLWLDGFAEMTPCELDLLAAVARRSETATMAFCLEDIPPTAAGSWLSIWAGIGKTFRQCHARLSALPGARITIETLERGKGRGRFAGNPALRHLEEKWVRPEVYVETAGAPAAGSLRLAQCSNPASEAVLAAREIRRFVRGGGRFREAAVLLRSMEGYHEELRRVFTRYQIPFFLDRRKAIGHHPLAELTRGVLRAVAFDWRQEDWLAVLKTGLVTPEEENVDRLENESLKRGWRGERWFAPLPADSANSDWAEQLRVKWIGPFAKFRSGFTALQFKLDGPQLSQAVRQLWQDLDVEKTLQEWSTTGSEENAVDMTVWRQMDEWLENLENAFKGDAMPLRNWLPIVEAGLSGLSVGAIPPVLDQVLVGTIDRSRNPELKLVLLVGVNETVFPATPPGGLVLSDMDREELIRHEVGLENRRRESLARERFLGYIACTRSRERLVMTCAQQDSAGNPLNPSPFFDHLRRLFPTLEIERFVTPDWQDAEHWSELGGLAARAGCGAPGLKKLVERPEFAPLREQMAVLESVGKPERLPPELAEALYGSTLRASVSRLEEFAACSFQFFVRSGLRAEERERFELDVRERGRFQHKVLELFHLELRRENKRWRDITRRRRGGASGNASTSCCRNFTRVC